MAGAVLVATLAGPLAHAALPGGEGQDPGWPLDVEAIAAYGLREVEPGFIPVRIAATRLRGDAAEPVIFRVTAATPPGSGQAPIDSVREESVATGAKKRLFVHAYAPCGGERLSLSVTDRAGRPLAAPLVFDHLSVETPPSPWQRTTAQAYPTSIGVGLVSSRPPAGALRSLRGLKLSTFATCDLVELPPAEIPDRFTGLDVLDVVILPDVEASALTPEQAETLRAWTLAGGRLVIEPGLDLSALKHPLFRDLLPSFEPRAATAAALLGTDVVPFQALDLADPAIDARRLPPRSAPARTMIARFRAGLGEVALLACSLSSGPFRFASEKLRETFWTHLLAEFSPLERPVHVTPWQDPVRAWVYGFRDGGGVDDLLLPPFDPPIGSMALLGLAYIVCVGPVNFIVLRRFAREGLAALTIPAISLAFVALIFVGGVILQGGAQSFEAEIVRSFAGERFAFAERIVAHVPERARTLAVKLRRDEAGGALAVTLRDPATRGFEVHERGHVEVERIAASRREAAFVRGLSIRDLGGGVRCRVEGSALAIANDSGRDLVHVTARMGTGLFEGGPVPAGTSASIPPSTATHYFQARSDARASLAGRARDFARAALPQQGARIVAVLGEPGERGSSPRADARADPERVEILVLEGENP